MTTVTSPSSIAEGHGKSGGENVASREVEEMIYRLALGSEVGVIGIPDPYWIEAVTAVVVPGSGHSLEAESVIARAANTWRLSRLPARHFRRDTAEKSEREAAKARVAQAPSTGRIGALLHCNCKAAARAIAIAAGNCRAEPTT